MRFLAGLTGAACHQGLCVARWRLRPACVVSGIGAFGFTLAMMLGLYPITESIDWVLHGAPNLHFWRESLRGGEFPWWNPHVGLGRPYASDLQSAVFYPPTWLFWLGETAGLSLFLGLHAFLALLGMHLLCRQLGGRGGFGLLGGGALLASMGFGGRLLVGHTFYFAGLCYLPLLLCMVVKLRLRPTRGRVGALGLGLALQFLTGHPQVFWNSVLGLGLLLTGLLVRRAPVTFWKRVPQIIAGLAAALVLAAGITAMAWLPFLDLIAEGNRQAATLEFASFGRFEAEDVVGIVTEPQGESRFNWEGNFRLGFAWTVPGLVGLTLLRSAAVRGLLLMGAVAFWFSFGAESWLFRLGFDFLPGASSFRMPARINALTLLALTTAAAVLLGRAKPPATLPWAGVAAVGGLLVGLLREYPFGGPTARIGSVEPLLALLLAAGAVYVWKRWPGGASRVRFVALALWLGLQVVEFSSAMGRYACLYSRKSVFGFAQEFPVVGELRAIQAASPTGLPLRVMVPRTLAPPNLGMRDRWTHVDSYTALFLRRPWVFLHGAAGVAAPVFMNASLAPEFYRRPPFSIPNLSLDLALDPASGSILVNTNPLPRAWVTFQPRLVDRPEAALAAVTNRLELPREGVVESALPFPARPPAEASGTAVIRRFRPSELEVHCRLSHPGLLVLNEAWFPGWHTEVAGQRIESQPVNYWMRGFALPAGEHLLQVRFCPRRLTEAGCLSLASLGVGLGAALGGRRCGERFAVMAR